MAGFSASPNREAGFSAIEMLVVAGIIVIVSGVVLMNIPSTRNRATLDLIAQEVAISVREAQVFGIATRAVGDNQFPAYGVYFSLLDDIGGSITGSQEFILFADLPDGDLPGNRAYNLSECGPDSNGECVERLTISGPFSITSLCVDDDCSIDELAISFKRPFPDALICPGNTGNEFDCVGQKATITLESSTGDKKNVIVWNNGQIAVESPQ